MPPKPRYKTETWWEILAFLDERIDPTTRTVQVDIETFVRHVGIDERSLYRYFAEMKDLNVIAVRRVSTDFVAGRQPNVYTLLVKPDELRELWAKNDVGTAAPEAAALHELEVPDEVRPSPHEDAISADVLATMAAVEVDENVQIDGWLAGSE